MVKMSDLDLRMYRGLEAVDGKAYLGSEKPGISEQYTHFFRFPSARRPISYPKPLYTPTKGVFVLGFPDAAPA